MAIGLITPTSYIWDDVLDAVNNSNIVLAPDRGRFHYRSEPWSPPVYTSLAGWMFLNYSLLVLLIALLGTVVWGVTHG
jgi:hypothetical protein